MGIVKAVDDIYLIFRGATVEIKGGWAFDAPPSPLRKRVKAISHKYFSKINIILKIKLSDFPSNSTYYYKLFCCALLNLMVLVYVPKQLLRSTNL